MQVQLEISSIEHPSLLHAMLDEAAARGVSVDRISQGGGPGLLTGAELEELCSVAHAADIEVFLFMASRGSLEPGASGSDQLRGEAAFADALDGVERARAAGADGVIVADLGLLAEAGRRRLSGTWPDVKIKTAAIIAPWNAATAALYETLGATSINVANAQPLRDLIALRRAISDAVTIDIYVEAPTAHGGGLRYREVREMARELAPLVLKMGLQTGDRLNPYGAHLEPGAERAIREKVRRAALVMEQIGVQT